MTRRFRPTVDQLVAATFALLAVRLGARAISDNSAFTHLRTGIDMVRHGYVPAIPRTDPYSFTAFGHPWVVQSWLAEFGVGWADRLGGHGAVVALSAVTMGGLAWLIATLARTGRPASTVVATFASLAIGFPFWAPRPLLVGLLCLALTVLVVERRSSRWWLLPIVWVWVNSHGSFPLGLLWIGATCVGAWIDSRNNADADAAEIPWGYLGAFFGGLLLSAVNPLGPRLLVFAGSALTKRDVFSHIVEWKTVDFQQAEGAVCLIGLLLAFMIVARRGVSWRYLLPAVGFLGLGLFAERNLAPLGIVMAPTLAYALRSSGVASREEPRRANTAIAGVLALVAGIFVLAGAAGSTIDSSDYPVASINWLQDQGRFVAPHRVATPDNVGNFLELQQRHSRFVFVDDRVDMYPAAVSEDYRDLMKGGNPALRVLAKWKIDTVLWHSDSALIDRLVASGGWRVVHRQVGWVAVELVKSP